MINLNIIPELYNTTLTYFFFILSFLMFYIAYKGYYVCVRDRTWTTKTNHKTVLSPEWIAVASDGCEQL